MKKIHIEYDDFGEYMEIMDDESDYRSCDQTDLKGVAELSEQ